MQTSQSTSQANSGSRASVPRPAGLPASPGAGSFPAAAPMALGREDPCRSGRGRGSGGEPVSLTAHRLYQPEPERGWGAPDGGMEGVGPGVGVDAPDRGEQLA